MDTVMIVDDVPLNRSFVRMLLEERNYRIIEAEDGQKALDLIKKDMPDLILLDIVMPNLNGFETLKIIRGTPELQHLPVILVSTVEEFSSKREGFLIGADDYIVKPFKPEELLLRVDVFLKIKKERDALVLKAVSLTESQKELLDHQSNIVEKEKEILLKQVYVTLHHEIRNPLTSVLIGSQILKEKFGKDTPEKKILVEIETCAKRIRDVMDALGELKSIVLEDYLAGIKMLHLPKPGSK